MMTRADGPLIADAEMDMPADGELDLGPIRILSCKRTWQSGTSHYVLSLTAGGSIIQIIASPTAQVVKIVKDGCELTASGSS